MQAKPKYSISKFSGMSDKGGTYYIDGFSVVKENGLTSLDESFTTTLKYDSSTTNFSNPALANIVAIATLNDLKDSTLSYPFNLAMDDNCQFFINPQYGTTPYQGYVGGLGSSGDFLFSQRPDLFQMLSGNIIFTSSRHLGLIIRGKVKAGSSTTTIIDSEGRNFTTLGLSTTGPNNTTLIS